MQQDLFLTSLNMSIFQILSGNENKKGRRAPDPSSYVTMSKSFVVSKFLYMSFANLEKKKNNLQSLHEAAMILRVFAKFGRV